MASVRGFPWHIAVCDLQEGIKCIPSGDGSEPSSHTLTGAGEAQKFLLIARHHTAGSPLLPGLNCSVLFPVVLLLVKMFWFSIRKIFLEKRGASFQCELAGSFPED